MFDLHWKKITVGFVLTLLLATMTSFSAQAQIKRSSNYNYNNFSSKPYYFGITLGYNRSNYRMYYSREFISSDSIATVAAITGPGVNIGAIGNLKLGEYFDLRLMFPTLSFAERRIEYNNPKGNDPYSRKINSVLLEIPFHVRYKSAPFHDKRVFLVAGCKYSYDLSSNSRTRQADSLIKITPADFQVEFGVGVQFFMPYFIFSPEFKVSQGVSNILIYNNNIEESNVIERILSRTFTLSFHFEG